MEGGGDNTRLEQELDEARKTGRLSLTGMQLPELPDSVRELKDLRDLYLVGCGLTSLPDWIGELSALQQLDLNSNSLTTLPRGLAELQHVQALRLGGNFSEAFSIEPLPDVVRELKSLQGLFLTYGRLTSLPGWIGELTELRTLRLEGNHLTELPAELGDLPRLASLRIDGNPLPPEVLAAAAAGDRELIAYLRRIRQDGERIHEAKLVLVGEGAVGKSSLLAALRGEAFVDGRDTTHGIEVKPLAVDHDGTTITLNGWDFGGQPVYRPTHQLFFSAPAVYVVTWKPRQGPEQGFVDYWIELIRHRVGSGARILVVATHGGPGQRSADLDQMRLPEKHSDTVVGFHTVDNETGHGIPELRAALAATAGGLPHIGRTYPRSWRRVLSALADDGCPFITYRDYVRLADEHDLSPDDARSLAGSAHCLGHWVHYGDDPDLAEVVVLRPDWLSRAISFVLDDGETARAHGLLPHRRLPSIWDNPERAPEDRYPLDVQRLFLGLMEKFGLSYRVGDDSDVEPLSLVGQLVPAAAPDLGPWAADVAPNEEELTQVCQVTEADIGAPATTEGLMYQLIVRFHRYSLGQDDVRRSVHWLGGMVLADSYNGTALLRVDGNRLEITVRAAYPPYLLGYLTDAIREHIESFWKGLAVQVMVPCSEPCGLGDPGRGLFDVGRLIDTKQAGRPEFPCTQQGCSHWQDVDRLLLGIPAARPMDVRLREIVSEAVGPPLQVLHAAVDDGFAELGSDVRRSASQAQEQIATLMQLLEDEGPDGPRLVSLVPVQRTLRRPQLRQRRMRLILWCEHSRLPVERLGPEGAGVYDVDIPHDWYLRAAPFVRAIAVALRAVLPLSLAAAKLDLDDEEWKDIGEHLELAKETAGLAADGVTRFVAPDEAPDIRADLVRAGGGVLRELQHLLRERDPSFGGLVRVRGERNEYLWVHPTYLPLYRSTLPVIPT